jgi:hypothetical protein
MVGGKGAAGEGRMRVHSILAVVALATVSAIGATQGASTRRPAAAPRVEAARGPGLGEIMSLQQMRHSKLWFAGSAGNWPLADYELDELKEGFDDVRRLFPTHEGVRLGPLMEVAEKVAIPDLAKAIAAQDAAGFAGAFDALTAACNGCHHAAKHGFIAIQRPTSLPYSNQSFAPGPN